MPMKHINLTRERIRSLDPGDMLGKTLELPRQILDGMRIGREFTERRALEPVAELEWVGLGGSAVAGDLLQGFGFAPPALPLSISTVRFPQLARMTRLICSYSGNTVESVRAFETTEPWNIWLAMSSGGRLMELAVKTGVPHVSIPAGYPPRAAVGFVLGAMFAIFEQVYHFRTADYEELARELAGDAEAYARLDRAENPALDLAARLVDRTPVIYSVDGLTMPPVSFRFRAQLAENAKIWSHSADLPELAHNEVEALSFLGQVLPPPLVILLGDWTLTGAFSDPRPGLRRLCEEMSIETISLDSMGAGRLVSGLRTMFRLDAASVYLALLCAVDPMEIPVITRLKQLGSNT
ncbi:MAG: SIS domain-containing protein [bacterium]|nr:SIS domain-containing protein [bacterium]